MSWYQGSHLRSTHLTYTGLFGELEHLNMKNVVYYKDKSRVVNLTYTGCLGGLEHLKIETRLINEILPSVMGEYVFLK